jgi:cystathionine beta-synthase
MKVYKNVLETIGNTPIVRLQKIGKSLEQKYGVEFYAKLEFMNPGGSVKDRIGVALIEDAERRGVLKPGGTIVEGTSGNTGVGLAMAAIAKGYKCIFVLPDKMSDEKIRVLRAFGAEVVVTPTAVEPEDPRSYYSVAKRLARETPNAIYIDQYNNLANRQAHYKMTGPEIWKQFPEIDVYVAGIGTGGTVCGTGKYLREQKPSLQVVAVDPVGSIVYDVFKKNPNYKATGYKIEGIGEDFIPANYDFDVISDIVQVADKDAFQMSRELLLKEGLFCGNSCGAAVSGALQYAEDHGHALEGKKVMIMLPDGGSRYLSKLYNDDWMKEVGFL